MSADYYFDLARKLNGANAAKYYNRAGNLNISSKNQKFSALCFKLGGQELESENKKYYAAEFYVKSALQYKHFDLNETIKLLNKAINLFAERKYYRLAATNLVLLSEINHKSNMIVEAIINLIRARRYYLILNLNFDEFNCLKKISKLYIENGDYEKALLVFEKIYMKKQSLETYFNIALLKLYIDINVCDNYIKSETSYTCTLEYYILFELIKAFYNIDKTAITKLTDRYNYKFSDWHIDIIKEISIRYQLL